MYNRYGLFIMTFTTALCMGMENEALSTEFYKSTAQQYEITFANYVKNLEKVSDVYVVTTLQDKNLMGYEATVERTNEASGFYCDVKSAKKSAGTIISEYQLAPNCPINIRETFTKLFHNKVGTYFCVLGRMLAHNLHLKLYEKDIVEKNINQAFQQVDYLENDFLRKAFSIYQKAQEKFKSKSAAFLIVRSYTCKQNQNYLSLIDEIFGQKLL